MHKQTKAIILVSTFKSYIGHKYLYVVTDVVYVSYAPFFFKKITVTVGKSSIQPSFCETLYNNI